MADDRLSQREFRMAILFVLTIGCIGLVTALIPTMFQTSDGVCVRVEQKSNATSYSCSAPPPRYDVVIVDLPLRDLK